MCFYDIPYLYINTGLWFYVHNELYASRPISPLTTINRCVTDSMAEVLGVCNLNFTKYMVRYKQKFQPKFDFSAMVHTLHTTANDYLELLDKIGTLLICTFMSPTPTLFFTAGRCTSLV